MRLWRGGAGRLRQFCWGSRMTGAVTFPPAVQWGTVWHGLRMALGGAQGSESQLCPALQLSLLPRPWVLSVKGRRHLVPCRGAERCLSRPWDPRALVGSRLGLRSGLEGAGSPSRTGMASLVSSLLLLAQRKHIDLVMR